MPQSSPARQLKLLMLGDSLVAGGEWPYFLPGYSIQNCGIPGLTTFELYQSLPSVQRFYPQVDYITVMIGTNDLLMGDFSFPQDLRKILENLSQSYPRSYRFVHSLLPMDVPYISQQTIQHCNQQIAQIAGETQWRYIDLYEKFTIAAKGLFELDGVHLTHLAYQLWAQILTKQIAISENCD